MTANTPIAWSADGHDGHTPDGYRAHIGPGGFTQRPHVRVRPPAGNLIATTLSARAGLPEAQREAERLITEDRSERAGGWAA